MSRDTTLLFEHFQEVSCKEDYDDDVSLLSFGDNKSYICDLFGQKKNLKKESQEEALEEAHKLYGRALKEGAPKTEELFLIIYQQVEKEKSEKYRRKDELLEEKLEEALQIELERQEAKEKDSEGEKGGEKSEEKVLENEIKLLIKKIAKVKLMIKGIRDDKDAQTDKKKSKKLKRLLEKYEEYKSRLAEKSDTATVDSTATVAGENSFEQFNRRDAGTGTESDDDDDQNDKRVEERIRNSEKVKSKRIIEMEKTKENNKKSEVIASTERNNEKKEDEGKEPELTGLQKLEARRSALLAEAQKLRQELGKN